MVALFAVLAVMSAIVVTEAKKEKKYNMVVFWRFMSVFMIIMTVAMMIISDLRS
jgi:hypothetical protein